MEEEIKLKKEHLEKYITKQLEGFKKRSVYNRSASIRQHGLVTLLGAAITILSGLDIELIAEHTRIVVLILGAAVTVIGAYKTFFNNKDLWIKNTMISNKLLKVKNDYEFFIAGKEFENIKIEDLEKYKIEVDNILKEANKLWEIARQNNN
ncbi:SLATT domain-containing protein [Flavivirga eckloniae]|uniref:DUF4231 domain-containing protein n=1 Tax=Flavivirga eckloniae TaxID=1803846 RepID=A0A2K9PRT6_9FLAO|nr:DUF4231 domain-containing protein [Flavivirga eckloniae]AUP79508.1 hypothetical protein C1H87_12645 [Flavivirga eckloniae]